MTQIDNPDGADATAPITATTDKRSKQIKVPADILIICGLIAFAGIMWWVYRGVDEAGWISHSQKSLVYFRTDWMAGEFRTCSTGFESKQAEILNCVRADDAEGQVEHRKFMIKFWGKVDAGPLFWECQRKEDNSFVCTVTTPGP